MIELQKDAMSHTGSVLVLLRKALAVSTKLAINDVQAWAKSEIEGYKSDVPDYRQFSCQIKARNPYHGWQPVRMHPNSPQDAELFEAMKTIKIGEPISEIETWLASEGVSVSQPLPDEIASMLSIDLPLARFVAKSSFAVVPDRVRSYILEWSLDLEKRGILGNGITFTQEEKAQANVINNFYAPQYQNNGQVGSMGDNAFANRIGQKIWSLFNKGASGD